MSQIKNPNLQEDNDFKKIVALVIRNYKLFMISLVVFFGLFLLDRARRAGARGGESAPENRRRRVDP